MKSRRIILILSFTLAVLGAMAQPYVSNLGRFEVDQIKGCAPLTVNLTIRPPLTCGGASTCDMQYEDNGSFQNETFSHTYSQPGTYKLLVLLQSQSGFDEITITVLPNTPPAFEVYSCGGNSAQVKITDTAYNQYVINYNDGSPDVVVPVGSLAKDSHTFPSSGPKNITVRGRNLGADDNCDPATQSIDALVTLPAPVINLLQVTDDATIQLDFLNQPNILYKLQIATNGTNFQALKDIYNTSTTTVTNLRPDDNYYCFRLGAFDPCNNVTVYSNVICSADFDLALQSDNNRLTWSTRSTGINTYSISKTNGAAINAAGTATSYDDTNVVCGTEYCYRLTSLYGNGSQSISLEKCGIAISTDIPSAPLNISTQVAGTSLDLVWSQDPAFNAATYSISKAGAVIGTSATPAFTDGSYDPAAGGCYTISYVDACGNISVMSTQACAIQLTGILQADNVVNLAWTAYNGWQNGVDHYVVEKYNDQGQLVQSFTTGTGLTFQDSEQDPGNQVVVYRIVAIAAEGGVVESISNTVTIVKQPNIFHPNAFTPNGDGLNDTFIVYGQYTERVEFKIFNRWGELLFYTTDLNQSWDGTYKGNTMPEGTYVFRAYLTDLAGNTSERSGNILLLRKR